MPQKCCSLYISHSYAARQVCCMSTTRVEETLWRSLYFFFTSCLESIRISSYPLQILSILIFSSVSIFIGFWLSGLLRILFITFLLHSDWSSFLYFHVLIENLKEYEFGSFKLRISKIVSTRLSWNLSFRHNRDMRRHDCLLLHDLFIFTLKTVLSHAFNVSNNW